jgi:hypothetical protein
MPRAAHEDHGRSLVVTNASAPAALFLLARCWVGTVSSRRVLPSGLDKFPKPFAALRSSTRELRAG